MYIKEKGNFRQRGNAPQDVEAGAAASARAVWCDARARLVGLAGEQAVAAWLDVLVPLDDDGHELTLGAPSAGIAQIVKTEFGEAIEEATARRVRVVRHALAAGAGRS